jgi:flagellar biosynthetic protein FlhB
MADKGQATEKPTQRRMERARREGRFATSRDAVAAMQFLCFTALLAGSGSMWYGGLTNAMRSLFVEAFGAGELDAARLLGMVDAIVKRVMLPLVAFAGLLAVAAFATQMAVTRFGFSVQALAPKFQRLNVVSRFTELPKQNVPVFLQSAILLPVFGLAVYGVVKDNFAQLALMPLEPVAESARQLAGSVQSLLWKGAMLFVVLGAVDYARQYRRHMADLRMSKHEVREENKETEGNPQVKGRIRQLRREWLRRRMMQQVPKATAVVVNPTHYAVALKYSLDSEGAPKVVAKGKNYLALRIRQKAVENQVPVVENPPLAQALYKSAEVGQEIPAHLFKAVAEILAYIYRVMGGRLPA